MYPGELAASDVPLTNGRGAFSASLAEYAITAALHFTKQVPRCMRNHEDKLWDKFEMSMLAALGSQELLGTSAPRTRPRNVRHAPGCPCERSLRKARPGRVPNASSAWLYPLPQATRQDTGAGRLR